jgi:pilus assembly protein CpaB
MKGTAVTVLMLSGALGAGSAAAYLANRHIETTLATRRAQIDAQYTPVNVVVANSNLRAGTPLSGDTVALREVPSAFLHSDAIPADEWNDVSGRVLAQPVKSGEPILRSHLAQDPGAGFSSQLAQGMRALTFPVDDEASISGMLSPGDRIDIFFTTSAGNESLTQPMLLNVPVIATGARTAINAAHFTDRRAGQFNTVTVSVSPADAAKITLAQDAGKITIALRQPDDDSAIQIARVTKQTLLNGDRVIRAASRSRVEIIMGGT